MINKFRQVPPIASSILGSLRGLGYSTEAALADIVDNSISASASEIKIKFHWNSSKSHIYILDNGHGMNESALTRAMTLGSQAPRSVRAEFDLGRFGFGLKTASFSQCTMLTVASKHEGKVSCLRWDLELLETNPDLGWAILEGASEHCADLIALLDNLESGTLVIWESLDRLITPAFDVDSFLDLIENIVKPHLSMVFHRLVDDPAKPLRIYVNDIPIKPWDPFMSGHPAKPWASPVQKRASLSGEIEVQCHVLPHRDKLSPQEYEVSGGPAGWSAQQGFYIYRNKRLLVAGGWLGLGTPKPWNREESFRLARIRVDLRNHSDFAWKIDIKKSVARPPAELRAWLTMLASNTRERSRQAFAFRGSPPTLLHSTISPEAVWKCEKTSTGVLYRINSKHPIVASTLTNATPEDREILLAMLEVIETTVPVQKIWLDTAEQRDTALTNFAGVEIGHVQQVLQVIYKDFVSRKRLQPDDAKFRLRNTEPFNSFPHLIDSL